MDTMDVACDACGRKNRVKVEKRYRAVCGACRSPLTDAVARVELNSMASETERILSDVLGNGKKVTVVWK